LVGQWWVGYGDLQAKTKELYKSGYSWVVTFDLAAFYDTISHDLLIKLLSPKGGNQQFADEVRTWLRSWSSSSKSSEYSHGIPQGPIASDILAEYVMLTIDEKMSSEFKYLRYVDDIRIMGKAEREITRAIVRLDQLCRDRGLIPQVDKLGIKKVSSSKELATIFPLLDTYFQGARRTPISEQRSLAAINTALDPTKKKMVDKTLFRFALFHAPKSQHILKLVLKLWRRFPEHTDAYVAFLESFGNSKAVLKYARAIVRAKYPYDFVNGEMWKLIARMSSPSEMRPLCQNAIDIVKSRTSQPATVIGALVFLCSAQNQGLGNYASFLGLIKHPLIQEFAAPFLPLSTSVGLRAAKQILLRSTPDAALSLTRSFQIAKINLSSILPKRSLHRVVQIVYEKAGIISAIRPAQHDAIGALLAKRYKVPNWSSWKKLLGVEYAHAQSTLIQANAYFEHHYTPWLAHQDAFNDVIFRALQKALAVAGSPDAIPTTNQSNELIDYGKLIHQINFVQAHRSLAKNLQSIHGRRNRLPSSHPYDKKSGAKSIPVKRSERRLLIKKLSQAYLEIIRISKQIGF